MFSFSCINERKNEVPFCMAVENGELMHECFTKHSRMHGNSKNETDEKKETDEKGNKRGVSMKRSKARTKERSPDGLSQPNQSTILVNLIWYY